MALIFILQNKEKSVFFRGKYLLQRQRAESLWGTCWFDAMSSAFLWQRQAG
jgi:hypothetical protein